MDILNDTGASKLSSRVFLKVNYSFKPRVLLRNVMSDAPEMFSGIGL